MAFVVFIVGGGGEGERSFCYEGQGITCLSSNTLHEGSPTEGASFGVVPIVEGTPFGAGIHSRGRAISKFLRPPPIIESPKPAQSPCNLCKAFSAGPRKLGAIPKAPTP